MPELLFVIQIKYSDVGIDCGVAKTDIVPVEGVRFVGDADLTTRQQMTFLHFRDPLSRADFLVAGIIVVSVGGGKAVGWR